MNAQWIIDTGPLVAYLNRKDRYHTWIVEQLKKMHPPFLTCEAVISETIFLLSSQITPTHQLLDFIENGYLKIPFVLKNEVIQIQKLIATYQNVPMSLADACLVRMSDLYTKTCVLTFDSDFQVYRRNRNKPIWLLSP